MIDLRKFKELKIQKLVYFEKIHSTNILAKEIDTGEDTLIIADEQYAGKGRFNRKWFSAVDGAYFSYIIPIKDIDIQLQLIPIASAIAIIDFLKKEKFTHIQYRWPNDVLINNKKISGILSELTQKSAIVGIGININNEVFPNEINNIASSMYLLMKRKFEKEFVIKSIINNIKNLIKDEQTIINFLNSNSMIGKSVRIKLLNKEITGECTGFTNDGAIKIKYNNNEEVFLAGDIEFLRL